MKSFGFKEDLVSLIIWIKLSRVIQNQRQIRICHFCSLNVSPDSCFFGLTWYFSFNISLFFNVLTVCFLVHVSLLCFDLKLCQNERFVLSSKFVWF